jgi:type IV pilus assembly protein PilA
MKRFRKSEGFTLIELLIVIIIIGILAAIAIPMFLSQRDKAKESAVKEGTHTIQVGVQSYAVDNNDNFPNDGITQGNLQDASGSPYVDIWPDNKFAANAAMADDATGTQGNFNYVPVNVDGVAGNETFYMYGYGKGTDNVIITVGDLNAIP